MRGRISKLHARYLTIFFGVLFIIMTVSPSLSPGRHAWQPIGIPLLFIWAICLVGFLASYRLAFMPDKKDVEPAQLDYDSLQHRLNQVNVAANVRKSTIDGVLREGLSERISLELDLDGLSGMLRPPMALLEGRDVRWPLASSADIAAIFQSSSRPLLILGTPGSGKTITLLELCEPLLLRAEAEPREPVPIVLNLSTWSQKQSPLEDWIADEMRRQYGLTKPITAVWMAYDHLYLLLDGLDEVRPDARDTCIQEINKYDKTHTSTLVVCSRPDEYAELAERLSLVRTVEIRPLDERQVDAYLSDERLRLSAVREAIYRGDTLRKLSSQPLMLNVMAVAYGGRSFEELLPLLESEDKRRTHLYNAYIEWALRQWPLAVTGFDTAGALSWLRFLARRLEEHSDTQFFIEDLQPEWLPERQCHWFPVLVGGPVGVLASVLFGVLGGALFGMLDGAVLGVLLGTIFGVYATGGGIKPVDELEIAFNLKSAGRSVKDENTHRYSLLAILIVVTLIGIPASLSFSLLVDNALGDVPVGVLIGLLVGVLGLLLGKMIEVSSVNLLHLFYPMESKRRDRPNYGIRRSALNALGGGILFGLSVGVLFGATSLTLGSVLFDVLISLLFGAWVGGLFGALRYGGRAVLQHYLLRLLLHLNRLLPFRIISFMEAMRERILVQRAGAHYRFIHRTFQEHIAALTDEKIEELAHIET